MHMSAFDLILLCLDIRINTYNYIYIYIYHMYLYLEITMDNVVLMTVINCLHNLTELFSGLVLIHMPILDKVLCEQQIQNVCMYVYTPLKNYSEMCV